MFIERFVEKVLLQQAKFPELVCNVLGEVGYRNVGTNDDLVVVIGLGLQAHHPAALVLTLSLKKNRALLLQLGKSLIPEFKMKNIAFARQQVVMDADASHRGN